MPDWGPVSSFPVSALPVSGGSLPTPPVGNSVDWPSPRRQPWFSHDPGQSSSLVRFFTPVVQPPFNQTDWLSPYRLVRRQDFFSSGSSLVTGAQPPVSQTDWPNTYRTVRRQDFFASGNSLTTPVVAPPPFNQTDWPVQRVGIKVQYDAGAGSRLIYQVAPPPSLPFRNADTYVPRAPARRLYDPGFNNPEYRPIVVGPKPFNQNQWDNPIRRVPSIQYLLLQQEFFSRIPPPPPTGDDDIVTSIVWG
jgi:hypothetical protein